MNVTQGEGRERKRERNRKREMDERRGNRKKKEGENLNELELGERFGRAFNTTMFNNGSVACLDSLLSFSLFLCLSFFLSLSDMVSLKKEKKVCPDPGDGEVERQIKRERETLA